MNEVFFYNIIVMCNTTLILHYMGIQSNCKIITGFTILCSVYQCFTNQKKKLPVIFVEMVYIFFLMMFLLFQERKQLELRKQ